MSTSIDAANDKRNEALRSAADAMDLIGEPDLAQKIRDMVIPVHPLRARIHTLIHNPEISWDETVDILMDIFVTEIEKVSANQSKNPGIIIDDV